MKKLFIFYFILPSIVFAQEKILQIIEPIINIKLQVSTSGCKYIDGDVYLINQNYIVYENCTSRKILFADMKSLSFPKLNEQNYFLLEKNAIYFRGEKIETDTTGFAIIGRNNDYKNSKVLWKTKDAVYKNTKKIQVSDIATFQALECINGPYFKDKNYLYYFDKKIENSDGETVQKSCDEFTLDKNNAYLNGAIITCNNEKIMPVNRVLFKTNKDVLIRQGDKFIIQPKIDATTLRSLSRGYSVDKNNLYLGIEIVPIKKELLQNIKVWDQVNSVYLSDGEKVYSNIKNNFDAKTFGMLPHSDFCFDKNGVYERKWIEAKNIVVYIKFPFKYLQPIDEKNTFITDDSRYICYENQAYDPWNKILYDNLTAEQIVLAKDNKLMLEKSGKDNLKIDKKYDYLLSKSGNKIYWDKKETIADALNFNYLGGGFYRDLKNVYSYSQGEGLLVVQGMDNETLERFNIFFRDKNYLYYYNHKIIKSKDIELLAVFAGYRMGCGLDRTPPSNYYLLKNFEGYWLVCISEKVSIRYLGMILSNQKEWLPDNDDNFETM